MIHILKSKSGYRVRYAGKNGEPLAVSEVLKSKANAWKNVRAMMKLCDCIAQVNDGDIKYAVMWNKGKWERLTITGDLSLGD